MTKVKSVSRASGKTWRDWDHSGSTLTTRIVNRLAQRVHWLLLRLSSKRQIGLALLQSFLPATVCTCTGLYPVLRPSGNGTLLRRPSKVCVRHTDCQPTMHAQLTLLGCCDQWEHITGKMQTTPRPFASYELPETVTNSQDSLRGLEVQQMWVDDAAEALVANIDQAIFQSIYDKQSMSRKVLVSTPRETVELRISGTFSTRDEDVQQVESIKVSRNGQPH